MNQLQQQHHHQRRRQSLLNRRVQEEFLIEQVKLHPVLYDKSMKAYRKPGATDSAWSEIAQAFGVKGIHLEPLEVQRCRQAMELSRTRRWTS